jgi:hypothetical protein
LRWATLPKKDPSPKSIGLPHGLGGNVTEPERLYVPMTVTGKKKQTFLPVANIIHMRETGLLSTFPMFHSSFKLQF